MSIWSTAVPNVAPGNPITAASVNNPINTLADQNQILKTLIDAVQAGNNLVLRNIPVDASVSSGMVSYFDGTTYTYKPSQAIYADLEAGADTVEPAEAAHFAGIIYNVTGNIGDLCMSGVVTLTVGEITALFGTATPDRGQYYLSSTTAGVVTSERPLLPVLCVEYMGNYMLRVYQPAFNNLTHTHREYSLAEADWLAAGTFDPTIVPAGATYGYDLSSATALAQNLIEVILPSVNYGVFTWAHNDPAEANDGLRVKESSIVVDENGIWWTEVAAPASAMWLNATAAQVGDVPVLHTAISRSPDQLTIQIIDGTLYLTVVEYEDVPDQAGSDVIKNIIGGKKYTGPVVEKVQVGPGLRLSPPGGQGIVTVELAQYSDYRVPSQILNLNQAVTEVAGIIPVTKFPSDRNSQVNCEVQLPSLPDDSLYELYIFMKVYGIGVLVSGGITVDYQNIPLPVYPAGVSASGVVNDVMADLPADADIHMLENAIPLDLTGLSGASFNYVIGIDTPAADIKMISTGVRLALK